MAEAAQALGHEWIALTDHFAPPGWGRMQPAFEAELALMEELNAGLAPFRILSGIEVDILEDGGLDQREGACSSGLTSSWPACTPSSGCRRGR